MAEFQAKYQKLATEYSKLKAQIPVLKKAYIDEQTENSTLKDALKEKEQSIRKYEQETDSLSFRNQQLSKRVLLLQEELEEAECLGNKKKNKTVAIAGLPKPNVEVGIFNEELQSKIEENARLHKQVNEASESYEKTVEELEKKLKSVELEQSQYSEVLNVTKQQSKAQIDKLQEDKAILQVKLVSNDSDMKKLKMRAEVAEIKLQSFEKDLTSKLEAAQKIISEKLPIIDTYDAQLNSLNIPTFDRRRQLQICELVSQAALYVGEFIQGLSNFYTYTEQRIKVYPKDIREEPLSGNNSLLCKALHENLLHCKPVETSLKKLYENLKDNSIISTLATELGLKSFCESFHNLVDYNTRILPLQLSCIEEECAISSCPSSLSSKNLELHSSLRNFNDGLIQFDSLLIKLGQPDTMKPADNTELFKNLTKSLSALHELIKEVSKHFNAKVCLEHQLPTTSQKLQTTDECILSSLISLVTSTRKLNTFLNSNMELCCGNVGIMTRGYVTNEDLSKTYPLVTSYKQATTDYIQNLSRPFSESIPHLTAIENRSILLRSTESKESFLKQMEKLQQRVGVLEQEKEHYLLELQLLKIKLENELHKQKEFETEILVLKGKENVPVNDSMESNTQDQLEHSKTKLGKLELNTSNTSGVESREQLIKSHFKTRLSLLTLQLQLADSKCVNFHAEVRALHKQLQRAEKQKSSATEELKQANMALALLRDEHQTTTKSYENQLSLMSEHLAGMNEKLAQQKDEIDEQKLQLQHGRSKILKKKK